jgi:hypothetical protein
MTYYSLQAPPSTDLTRSDGVNVPNTDPDYLAWVAAGNAPLIVPAPPPNNPVGIDWLTFMGLFTPAEQAAIALSTDPHVAVFRMMAMGLGGDLILSDPRVAMGLATCVAAGCLSSSRVPLILSMQAPTS